MAHFGVLTIKGTGHLNPLIALARRLTANGHRVIFFQVPELEARIRHAGLEFVRIGTSISQDDSARRLSGKPTSRCSGSELTDRIRRIISEMEASLKQTPHLLVGANVDAMIIDEIILSGPTIAQMLRLPYFLVSTSMPHQFGWNAPWDSSAWNLREFALRRRQNSLLEVSVHRTRGPIRRWLDDYRQKVGLRPIRTIRRDFPELAHISQFPQCLDLPDRHVPHSFHYCGPFVDQTTRPSVDFPWHQIDGRPLVYASLGTTKKTSPALFKLIAAACNRLNHQLVVSLGGRLDPKTLDGLPGNPIVVKYAPQLALLSRAEVVITHAGLNTALETLLEGKPILAIPIAHDQPAVAARLARSGVAEIIPAEKVSAKILDRALAKLIYDPCYRNAAMQAQAELLSLRGLDRAVNIIETSLRDSTR